jgi:hypothetical protein
MEDYSKIMNASVEKTREVDSIPKEKITYEEHMIFNIHHSEIIDENYFKSDSGEPFVIGDKKIKCFILSETNPNGIKGYLAIKYSEIGKLYDLVEDNLSIKGATVVKKISNKMSDNEITWDYNGWRQTDMERNPFTQFDWNQTLWTKINQALALVYEKTNNFRKNKIQINFKLYDVIRNLEYFIKPDETPIIFKNGIGEVGSFFGIPVYISDYIYDDIILVFNEENLEKCVVKVINYENV